MKTVMNNDASNNGIRTQDSTEMVLTVPEAAEFLRVSESIIRRLIRENRIPYFQIEGRYLFYLPSLQTWISEKIVTADGEAASVKAQETADSVWNRTKGALDGNA
jgi:excisionase family DNA binding protein